MRWMRSGDFKPKQKIRAVFFPRNTEAFREKCGDEFTDMLIEKRQQITGACADWGGWLDLSRLPVSSNTTFAIRDER